MSLIRPRIQPFEEATLNSPSDCSASQFFCVKIQEIEISIHKADTWVNATHLLNAAKVDRRKSRRSKILSGHKYQVVRGYWRHQGTYVPLDTALALCRSYGLQRFMEPLQKITSMTHEPVAPKYFGVSNGRHSVSVRDDGYVNLTQILQVVGKNRSEVAAELKEWKKVPRFDIVRGRSDVQGTYIEFPEAIKICEEYELGFVEAGLKKYQCRNSFLERPHSTAEPPPYLPDENLARRVPDQSSSLPSDELHCPGEAEQRPHSQSQTYGTSPVRRLSASSIEPPDAVESDKSAPSRMDRRGCHQVRQDTEPLLYTISQQSCLSQVRPSFGIDESSMDYSKYLDEHDNVPLLGTETVVESSWVTSEQ